MRRPVLIALGALLLLGAPLLAQEESDITVTGTHSYALDGKTLRRIGASFRENRALAPNAPLAFRLSDSSGLAAPLLLWVEDGDERIEIPGTTSGLITLPPQAFAPGARLHSNRRRGAISLRPEILSPGTSVWARRMGDLRLQCALIWAIESGSAPVAAKAMFALSGGMCKSRKIDIFLQGPETMTGGAVDGSPAGVKPVRVWQGRFAPPLQDRRLSNEAIVRLRGGAA